MQPDSLDGFRKRKERLQIENEKKVRNKLQQEKLKAAYIEVFSTPQGLKVLEDIQELCGYVMTPVVAGRHSGEICPYSTVYKNTQQNVFRNILSNLPTKIKRKLVK